VHFLNLGLLAHVDAGKTTLTERLLHAAGVIEAMGRVDDGTTQTDSLALERRRGITIKAAVASFVVDDVAVNLIDTPGHPDFIAEVERVLRVLDGAVLLVSAVEGVQAQTRVLMRALQRLGIPTLIFVNKVDRPGANLPRVLEGLARRLTPAIVPMGTVASAGGAGARFVPYAPADPAFARHLADRLTEHDDALLAAYVAGEEPVAPERLRATLAAQSRRGLVHPVFCGSARTGTGVDALIAGLGDLLPGDGGDPEAPAAGEVFKVERGPGGERLAYVRMRAGTVRTRDRLALSAGEARKVTAIEVFDRGGAVPAIALPAGRIGRLRGLSDVRIGDRIGTGFESGRTERQFAPPTLETVVRARPGERRALHLALAQLAEQDPLIALRHDPLRDELSVSLYGEVQKEVIQATLADEFGIEVAFSETTTICVERPVGRGEAVEHIDEDSPFLATVGLQVEPAPAGRGVTFRLGVELGSMPPAFFGVVEDTVRETLAQGLHGWAVTDCAVTMTHAGYWARQGARGVFDKRSSSTAGDFRSLTPLVLMAALRAAGTQVLEPLHRFRVEIPEGALGAVLPLVGALGGVPETPLRHDAAWTLEGEIPAARVHALGQRLPALTRGEGVLESTFARHAPVRGPVPTRERTDADPLDREAYLLRVGRRGALV
jgi:ribosomal protection tetracycline resistance protein